MADMVEDHSVTLSSDSRHREGRTTKLEKKVDELCHKVKVRIYKLNIM